MTFHQRARMLKAMAMHLSERKDDFYALSGRDRCPRRTTRGSTSNGGMGTFFV
jgi:oxepin-CoA hydrolase/3-oxo-5,6-dehydrosuberyl-CoA semialdehyde dehydrogenase